MAAPARRLVLLPGLLCTKEVWRHQVAALAKAWPPIEPIIPSVSNYMDIRGLAQYLLNSIEGRFSLAGFSFGGYVALEMARQAPNRLERLALISSQARADSASTRKRREDLIHLAQREGSLEHVADLQAPLLLHPQHFEADARRRMSESQSPHCTALRMASETSIDDFIRQQTTIMSRSDNREVLSRLACPLLLLFGRSDQLVPYSAQEEMWTVALTSPHLEAVEDEGGILHAPSKGPRFPCRLHGVEGAGHMTPLEAPEEVSEAMLRWMDDPPAFEHVQE